MTVDYLKRRVGGFPAHAVMVGREINRHESGAANHHRVDGVAVHPTRCDGLAVTTARKRFDSH
jgi:hypothetical protein